MQSALIFAAFATPAGEPPPSSEFAAFDPPALVSRPVHAPAAGVSAAPAPFAGAGSFPTPVTYAPGAAWPNTASPAAVPFPALTHTYAPGAVPGGITNCPPSG